MDRKIFSEKFLNKDIYLSGDKKITQIVLILSAISEGASAFSNFPSGKDIYCTVNILDALGIKIEISGSEAKIFGKGINSLSCPKSILDATESKESLFLFTGLLSAQNFDSCIKASLYDTEDSYYYLCDLLSQMNAEIDIEHYENHALIKISGKKLSGKEHIVSNTSALVKNALFLAGLFAENETSVTETFPTHNHMENMITAFGGNFGVCHHQRLVCHKASSLEGKNFYIPGDISYGLFLIMTSALTPDSNIKIKNICLNYSRIGFIYALLKMGVKLKIPKETSSLNESFGIMEAKFSPDLKGISFEKSMLQQIINELPFFIVFALFTNGKTEINKSDIDFTETVPILIEELLKLGADISETSEKIIIMGNQTSLKGVCSARGSFELSLCLLLVSLKSGNKVIIKNANFQNTGLNILTDE